MGMALVTKNIMNPAKMAKVMHAVLAIMCHGQ